MRWLPALTLLSSIVIEAAAAELEITAATDAVDGDTTSVAALLLRPGADGISVREALEAAARTSGPHVIRFSPALNGRTIALAQPLFMHGAGVELQGTLAPDGRPSITLDGTAISTPLCCRAMVFVLASSCRISRLRFTGASNHAVEVRAGTWPLGPSAPLVVRDVLIDGNEFDGSLAGGLPSAIRIWDSSVTEGSVLERITVTRNVIRDYTDVAIIANTCGTGALLRDLVVSENDISGTPFPIEIAAGLASQRSTIERTRIIGNRISGGTVQLLIGSLSGGAPVSGNQMNDTLIARNTMSGELDSLDIAGGLFPAATGNSVTGVQITNNVIAGGRGITILGGSDGSRNNTVRGVAIANNTIVMRPLSPVTALANRDGALENSVAEVSIVNTIAVRPDGGPDRDLAGELRVADVSHTLTSDGTFAGMNGNLQGDPRFEPGSYRIGAASAAVDGGTTQNAPLLDIECGRRVGATDIGAFERGAAPAARLTTVVQGRGTIAASPEGTDCFGTRAYAPGTVVALTVHATPGARFLRWSGDADCTDGTVTVTNDVYCAAVMTEIGARRRSARP